MVRIDDDWVILMDSYNYMLAKDTHRVNKNTGTPEWDIVAYLGGVEQCVEELLKIKIKNALRGSQHTLRESVDEIKRVTNDFRYDLRKAGLKM